MNRTYCVSFTTARRERMTTEDLWANHGLTVIVACFPWNRDSAAAVVFPENEPSNPIITVRRVRNRYCSSPKTPPTPTYPRVLGSTTRNLLHFDSILRTQGQGFAGACKRTLHKVLVISLICKLASSLLYNTLRHRKLNSVPQASTGPLSPKFKSRITLGIIIDYHNRIQ